MHTYLKSSFSIIWICSFHRIDCKHHRLGVISPHSLWHGEVCVCAKSCPTLCSPMYCSARPFCPWNFSSNNTGVGHHFLLQGIPKIESMSLTSPALASVFFAISITWEAPAWWGVHCYLCSLNWWIKQLLNTKINM